MDKIDKFLQYFIAKYFVFTKSQIIDLQNVTELEKLTINDIETFKKSLKIPKKITDATMCTLTKDILENFVCMSIDLIIDSVENSIENLKINSSNNQNIYNHYKKYKTSSTTTKETETYLKLNPNSTQKVKPINVNIELTEETKKQLIHTYNDQNTITRSEYKFEFITGSKIYTFRLYSSDETNTWKLESNTTKGDIHNSFIQFLYKSIGSICSNEHEGNCC